MSGSTPRLQLVPLHSPHDVQAPHSTSTQPNSEYKVEAVLNMNRDTYLSGGTTRHDSGGGRTTRHLGTWVRQRCLARGGFGVVYLERNPSSGEVRAVKRLEGGNIPLYDREIAQMIDLQRYEKLFVMFYCWFSDPSCNMYVAMKYHKAGDLKGYVDAFGAFTEDEGKAITEQILQGVFILHELGITHRDIKPENLLIASTNPVMIKIADFGQAKTLRGSYHTRVGTEGWAAPELETQYYDKRVDLWSVGCVVYYLLTTLNPFTDGGVDSSQANIAKFTFPFWPRLQRHQFQEYSENPGSGARPRRGDQIVINGISNTGNAFLKALIVHDPGLRMTALEALDHPWIRRTTPLQSALESGDFRLASLLAVHDSRYRCKLEKQFLWAIAPIVLRIAAASGHEYLVEWGLKNTPANYEPTYKIPSWPMKPALEEAAANGHTPIVELLIRKLPKTEKTPQIFLRACKAALRGGHHQVVEVIWSLVSTHDRTWDDLLSLHVARYGDFATILIAHETWANANERNPKANRRTGLREMPASAYAHHFPKMLNHAARYGNTDRVRWFLVTRPSGTGIPDAALYNAVEGGHLDIVVLLLKADPVVVQTHIAPDRVLVSALGHAAFLGHMHVVRCLVEQGAVPNADTIQDAVLGNNGDIFRYLVLLSCDMFDAASIAQDITPAAVPYCDIPMLTWLSANRVSGTLPGDATKHIRHAARLGAGEIVRWFISQAGKDLIAIHLIREAIIGAAEMGHVDLLVRLCVKPTDARISESWEGAARGGHIAVLDQLLIKNRNPNKAVLRRALIAAVNENQFTTVLWLLAVGASAVDGRGSVPKFRCDLVIQELVNDFGNSA